MSGRRRHAGSSAGFTLIEVMVAVAVLALLMVVAAPSFTSFTAKKRVEGLAAELTGDLQYARSEAVARNVPVQITFGTGCYVIHALAGTATSVSTATSCTQSAASTIGTGETEIKTVQIQTGTNASFTPQASMTAVMFDPVRAMPTFAPSSLTTGEVQVSSTVGSWTLSSIVTSAGRARTCGSMVGYSSCS
jgi:type II secretion system protein H